MVESRVGTESGGTPRHPAPGVTGGRLASGLLAFVLCTGAGVATAQSPLIEAVKQGDVAGVRAMLGQGAAVDAPEMDGTTALHWAVHRDDGDIASLLIGAGADVTAANRYGVAPIALASLNGSAPMLARLLAAGADVNRAQPEGETALMTAARTGRVEAVRLLLDHGADADAAEQWRGQTALMWAAAEGHTAAVRELVSHGADVHARSGHAARSEHAEGSAIGSAAGDDAGAEDEAAPPRGFSAFLFAVQGGHLDAATVLADAGADVDDMAPDGSSALVVAVDNRHYELAAWLVDRGADPNADGVGWTALHTAVLAHRPHFRVVPDPSPTGRLSSGALIEALLAAGADPECAVPRARPVGHADLAAVPHGGSDPVPARRHRRGRAAHAPAAGPRRGYERHHRERVDGADGGGRGRDLRGAGRRIGSRRARSGHAAARFRR